MDRKRVTLLALLAVTTILAAGGCTGSDPLKNNSGDLVLQITPAPTLDPPILYGSATIRRIEFRPDDPVADADLGGAALAITPTAVTVDLLAGTTVSTEGLSLMPGSYRVVSVTFGGLAVNTLDASAPPQTPELTCEDGHWTQASVTDDKLMTGLSSVDYSALPDQPHFQVPANGASTLTMTIHGDVLETLFDQKFRCDLSEPSIDSFSADDLLSVLDFQ